MEMPLLIVAASCNRHPIVKGTVSYLSVIRVLIDHGVDINATDGMGTRNNSVIRPTPFFVKLINVCSRLLSALP